MPVYTYRREDGTTFDYKQKFSDDPLQVDPETGQKVVRLVQSTGVIFKGSGFYINDSKSSSNGRSTLPKSNGDKAENGTSKDAPASAENGKSKETTTASTSDNKTKSSAAD